MMMNSKYLSKSSWNLFPTSNQPTQQSNFATHDGGSQSIVNQSNSIRGNNTLSRPAVFSTSNHRTGGPSAVPPDGPAPRGKSRGLSLSHSPSFNHLNPQKLPPRTLNQLPTSSSTIRRTPSLSSLFRPFSSKSSQSSGSGLQNVGYSQTLNRRALKAEGCQKRNSLQHIQSSSSSTITGPSHKSPFSGNLHQGGLTGGSLLCDQHASRGQEVSRQLASTSRQQQPPTTSCMTSRRTNRRNTTNCSLLLATVNGNQDRRHSGYLTTAGSGAAPLDQEGDAFRSMSILPLTIQRPTTRVTAMDGAVMVDSTKADLMAATSSKVVLRLEDQFETEMRLRRYDNYIADLEVSAIDNAGPTIRAIYDGDEHEKFMERLESRIRAHDKDIERMCNAHYQGFVDCIHALLQVRPQAHRLKREIESINKDTQKSSENVIRKADELIKYRRILVNAEQAMDSISICVPIMEKFHKLELLLEDKRYEHALKTLEDLEKNSLPRVNKYRWASAMVTRIPGMREEIKNACMSQLKDFLEEVRQATSKMGELAMKSAAAQHTNLDDGLMQIANMGISDQGSRSSSAKRDSFIPAGHSGSSSPEFASKNLANRRKSSTGNLMNGINGANNGPIPAARHKKRKAPPPPANPFNRAINSTSATTFDHNGVQIPSDSTDSGTHSLPQNGALSSQSSGEEELAPTDLVNFKPVYRCQFIFQSLGAREEFETYYRMQRQQQARLALQPPSHNVHHETIEAQFREYFASVVGFFVIEDYLLKTGQGLVTKSALDEMWQSALQTIVGSLRTHSSYCTEADVMLQIKRLIILLAFTLQSYGYSVTALHNLLVEIQDHYNELLLKQWGVAFRKLFEEDNYHPIQVNSQLDYFTIMEEFPFYEPESVSNPEYPKKYPFSSFVPNAYREMKLFIRACLKYSQDLSQLVVSTSGAGNPTGAMCNSQVYNHLEVEDMVRKATNMLLTRTLGGCLSGLIRKPNLGLLQLIQITINTNYLEEACIFLEEYIAKTIHATLGGTGISATPSTTTSSSQGTTSSNTPSTPSQPHLPGDRFLGNNFVPINPSTSPYHTAHPSVIQQINAVHLAKLQGKSMFKDIRSEAESQIYMQLNLKIDEFMELATYDWLMTEPQAGVASPYITDLIAFLRSTFQAFTNLPDKVAQTACLSACKHVSSSLMNLLMSEHVTAISWGAFSQFNLDLLQCELFAASEPVKGFEEGSLGLCFAELRQLMDLFLAWDWATYLSDHGKQESKYLRVNPSKALVLLEKMWEAENAKKNFLTSLKKNERDRKKLIDTVVRELKMLVMKSQGGHSSGGNMASTGGYQPPQYAPPPPAVSSAPQQQQQHDSAYNSTSTTSANNSNSDSSNSKSHPSDHNETKQLSEAAANGTATVEGAVV